MKASPTSEPAQGAGPEPGPALEPVSGPLHGLDSTAQLMTRLTAQLHTQLTAVRRPAAPALVAVAHGSRDPGALATVTALLTSVRALRPGLRVELGHIELNEPRLSQTLSALPARGEVVLVPLLFGPGHHVKHDIPRALAAASHLRGVVSDPLGPHPLLAEALHDRLNEAVRREGALPGEDGLRGGEAAHGQAGPDAVVLASAGSRDPESAEGSQRIAAALRERLGGTIPVLPAYASAARPTVAEAVQILRAAGHSRIALASCFTAPGHFAARCAAAAPWTASAPIGAHPALARLVLHRYDEARAAAAAGRRLVHA
ncbi:sirohydrochlorin chelatase [Streptomyces bathyalis]|uniref:Sirohydrochlorin chelatase n=1 Tax=Streptomyces bathyalis TaxID=2710756 RepID=A0A7T1T9Q9_9ACTN|nr:sirohydrochlorin chelatase [Streptomyces bathyalis]